MKPPIRTPLFEARPSCRLRRAPHTENIEVDGSHFGLGWNAEVLSVIADRLRQPAGAWQRHHRSMAPFHSA